MASPMSGDRLSESGMSSAEHRRPMSDLPSDPLGYINSLTAALERAEADSSNYDYSLRRCHEDLHELHHRLDELMVANAVLRDELSKSHSVVVRREDDLRCLEEKYIRSVEALKSEVQYWVAKYLDVSVPHASISASVSPFATMFSPTFDVGGSSTMDAPKTSAS